MKMTGYIKLYRQFKNWEWYNDINTKVLFLEILLSVCYTDTNYQGLKISKGQLLTTISELAVKTNLSVQNVRTSIKRLKSTNEITTQVTSKGTLISVTNWGKYQVLIDEPTSEVTSKLTTSQQTSNKQVTNAIEKESKEINNINNYTTRTRVKKKYGEFQNVFLTDTEVEKLKKQLPNFDKNLETFSKKLEKKGYKYKSHYLAMLDWFKTDEPERDDKPSYDIEKIKKRVNNFE